MTSKYTLLVPATDEVRKSILEMKGLLQQSGTTLDVEVLEVDPSTIPDGKPILVDSAALAWMKGEISRRLDGLLQR